MSEDNGPPDGADWDWVTDPEFGLALCLIFARGVTPQRIIEAFGLDPAVAQLLPESRAHEAPACIVPDADITMGQSWVRAGQAGEWGFAIDQSALNAEYYDEVACDLSQGSEAVEIFRAMELTGVEYLADGSVVTSFEPGAEWDRAGSRPDQFLPEMRAAGLATEVPGDADFAGAGDGSGDGDPLVPALTMLTRALGIRLSAEEVRGPLLTVQRRPAGP
jgi:hypothetical protein